MYWLLPDKTLFDLGLQEYHFRPDDGTFFHQVRECECGNIRHDFPVHGE
ncbi:hypothetical protein DAQ1742_00796 [Dickeya aquatica]|uniref:Uncharacterized protein n=1 Tax=Dickeya aquatica TaxID=1401087 RepID=A0A375A758_9GAMM|nr:hypothetical protein DAQ1742_00796 [Dickeya aquatica]